MARNPRAAAARVIGQVLDGRSLNQVLPEALAGEAAADRPFLQQLCYGTLRQAPRLRPLLAMLLDKPLRARDSDVEGLLLCGLYQIVGLRVPDHAAVAETVAATTILNKRWAKGMSNAVLRRFLRERESLEQALLPAQAAAHPAWLFDLIHAQWPARADAIIAANNSQPPLSLRVNRRMGSRQEYLDTLAAAGIEATAGLLSPDALTLASGRDVSDIPGFNDGRVSVQDEAAQLAAGLLGAQPGERILDACAAPGGKACHILEQQPALAELVAMDVDGARLARVADNLDRLGLAAVLVEGDGAAPPAQLTQLSFDRILVDAPCSATGVIRRHPDVKLLRRQQDLAALAAQQQRILQGLWPLLRPGGVLLYVTCSILAQENDEVVARFLDGCPDAVAQELENGPGETAGHGRQLLPAVDGGDGLFYARLRKST